MNCALSKLTTLLSYHLSQSNAATSAIRKARGHLIATLDSAIPRTDFDARPTRNYSPLLAAAIDSSRGHRTADCAGAVALVQPMLP